MQWVESRMELIESYIAIRKVVLQSFSRPATAADASYEAEEDDNEDDEDEDVEDEDAGEEEDGEEEDDEDDTEVVVQPWRNNKPLGMPDYARIDYVAPPTAPSKPAAAGPKTSPPTKSKRSHSEINAPSSSNAWQNSEEEDEASSSSPPPAKKHKRGTGERPTSNDHLVAFEPINEKLVRSLDHSVKLPDSKTRVACPYPAPFDILAASQIKYQSLCHESAAKSGNGNRDRVAFTIFEDDQIIRHMLAVRLDASIPETERRFEVVSQRMAKDPRTPVPRSKMALKNMWCRVGRARSGFDERKAGNQDLEKVANRNPKYGKK